MKIQAGPPPSDGYYVAYVRCDSYQIKDWCQPIIVSWAFGKWQTVKHVHGWIGPLPAAKWRALLDAANALEPETPSPLCSVCQEPQENTPSGMVCKNGHGGADPLEFDL